MEVAVAALDKCRVRILARLLLENPEHFKVLAISTHREVKRGTTFVGVIVDENDAPVA
jgi:hypothetical protein